MTLVAPGIAERFRPGQFVAVAVGGEHTSMLIRRCFGVREVKPDYGGTVEIVFAVREPGTAWLAGLRPRDRIDLARPARAPVPAAARPGELRARRRGPRRGRRVPARGRVLRQRDCRCTSCSAGRPAAGVRLPHGAAHRRLRHRRHRGRVGGGAGHGPRRPAPRHRGDRRRRRVRVRPHGPAPVGHAGRRATSASPPRWRSRSSCTTGRAASACAWRACCRSTATTA